MNGVRQQLDPLRGRTGPRAEFLRGDVADRDDPSRASRKHISKEAAGGLPRVDAVDEQDERRTEPAAREPRERQQVDVPAHDEVGAGVGRALDADRVERRRDVAELAAGAGREVVEPRGQRPRRRGHVPGQRDDPRAPREAAQCLQKEVFLGFDGFSCGFHGETITLNVPPNSLDDMTDEAIVQLARNYLQRGIKEVAQNSPLSGKDATQAQTLLNVSKLKAYAPGTRIGGPRLDAEERMARQIFGEYEASEQGRAILAKAFGPLPVGKKTEAYQTYKATVVAHPKVREEAKARLAAMDEF